MNKYFPYAGGFYLEGRPGSVTPQKVTQSVDSHSAQWRVLKMYTHTHTHT